MGSKAGHARGATMTDKFLSVEEAAALLGITTDAVYRKIARGQIPYRKWGRRVLFKHTELLAFLENLPGPRSEDVRRRWHPR